jgi:hypothetical protein
MAHIAYTESLTITSGDIETLKQKKQKTSKDYIERVIEYARNHVNKYFKIYY